MAKPKVVTAFSNAGKEADRLVGGSFVPAKRIEIFKKVAEIAVKDRPVIYLYHQRPLYAATSRLSAAISSCNRAMSDCRRATSASSSERFSGTTWHDQPAVCARQ